MNSTAISSHVSIAVIEGLLARYGEHETADILGVPLQRLMELSRGKGKLSVRQKERISQQTGQTWHRWAIDSVPVAPGDMEAAAFRADTLKMLAKVERAGLVRDRPKKVSTRRSQVSRGKNVGTRRALRAGH
jgi:hypothetical protein